MKTALHAFALVAVSALLRGWAISMLWGWFVSEPLGVREISWLNGLGLALLFVVFTDTSPKLANEPAEAEPDIGGYWLKAVLAPLSMVGVGLIIRTVS